jgi:hypothetical protein
MTLDEIKFLANKIAEEREVFVEDLAMGRAEEHAQYMHACGIIRGFDIIQGLLADLAKNVERGDDE